MAEAFLDSSVVIGLLFRHAGERVACQEILPPLAKPVCSRYVAFEVARGFLRSLIALHNLSFEYPSFSALHQAAHSGQQRFKPYRMASWLGAFDDYFAALEAEGGASTEVLKLEEFRAKLRVWIRRGWRHIGKDFRVINEIGCREDLPPPTVRPDGRCDQRLPDKDCGQPDACRLLAFVGSEKRKVELLAEVMDALPSETKDGETRRRIAALRHLLTKGPGMEFEGDQCHRCGDAMICLEAPDGHVIATKNRRHFEPIAKALGKPIVVAESSRSTSVPPPAA
jgi:hypothetical protein